MTNTKKRALLCILDGWGISEDTKYNAVYSANTPNFDKYFSSMPSTTIHADGLNVGLPEGQMGNSEVGHLNIGAGRIVYQELTRINKAIDEGEFFKNIELLNAINHCKNNNSALHIFGLTSPGGVHSSMKHLKALIKMAAKDSCITHTMPSANSGLLIVSRSWGLQSEWRRCWCRAIRIRFSWTRIPLR